jgi:hypothetical protein
MLRLYRIITLVLAGLTLYLSDVHPAAKIPRIGVLLPSDGGGTPIKALRQGLSDFGYVEGNNIFIEYRFSKGSPKNISHLSAELIDKTGQSDSYRGHRTGASYPTGEHYHSHRSSYQWRPSCDRTGRESGAAGWKHYRAVDDLAGTQRKTTRTAQGSRS